MLIAVAIESTDRESLMGQKMSSIATFWLQRFDKFLRKNYVKNLCC